jgi:hypothetical protein
MTGAQVNGGTVDAIKAGKGYTPASVSGTIPQASYTGPSGFSSVGSWGGAQAATNSANQWNNMSGDETGVQTQLKSIWGNQPYSEGENRLDSAITLSDGGQPILQNSAAKWSGISGVLDSANNAVQGQIDNANTQANAVQSQWQNAYDAAQNKADQSNEFYGKVDRDATYLRNWQASQKAEPPKAQKKSEMPADTGPRVITGGTTTVTPAGTAPRDPDPQASSINWNLDPRNTFNPLSPELGSFAPILTVGSMAGDKANKWGKENTGMDIDAGDLAVPGWDQTSSWLNKKTTPWLNKQF